MNCTSCHASARTMKRDPMPSMFGDDIEQATILRRPQLERAHPATVSVCVGEGAIR